MAYWTEWLERSEQLSYIHISLSNSEQIDLSSVVWY